jgi:hypothetical protein
LVEASKMRPFYIVPFDEYEFGVPGAEDIPMPSFWHIETGKEKRVKILEELNAFKPGPGVETIHLKVSNRVKLADHADKIPEFIKN